MHLELGKGVLLQSFKEQLFSILLDHLLGQMFVTVHNLHHYVNMVQDQLRLEIILGYASQHTAKALGHIPYIQDSFKFESVVRPDSSLKRVLVNH